MLAIKEPYITEIYLYQVLFMFFYASFIMSDGVKVHFYPCLINSHSMRTNRWVDGGGVHAFIALALDGGTW
jgi:hypothetical protein